VFLLHLQTTRRKTHHTPCCLSPEPAWLLIDPSQAELLFFSGKSSADLFGASVAE
jgi:hypothetical protein